jgi:hypothetical protein
LRVLPFELYMRQINNGTVPPVWVVKRFDVVEFIGSRGILCQVDPPPDPVALEQAKETFYRCVVIAIASSAHAAHQAKGRKKIPPIMACVDRILIRVNQGAWLGLAPPYR